MSVVVIGFFQFVLLLGAMGAFIAMIIILLLALVEGAQALGARQWAGRAAPSWTCILPLHWTSRTPSRSRFSIVPSFRIFILSKASSKSVTGLCSVHPKNIRNAQRRKRWQVHSTRACP